VAGVLLLAGAGAWYWSAKQEKTLGPDQLPGVNYDPATEQDNKDIEERKNADDPKDTSDSVSPTAPDDPTIGITLAAAGQDYPRGPVIARTVLSNATKGTCKLTLAKDAVKIERSAQIILQGNYYTCEGFDVAYGDVSPGSWKLTLAVTTDKGTNKVERDVEVQ
jgi:hypothetical protein